MTKKAVKPVKRVDWEAVKRDYRTNRLTQTELSAKHDIDPATLSRKIKRDREKDPNDWPQDLSKAVREATNARVMTEMVKDAVRGGQESIKDTVLAAAELNAQVILRHRSRVEKAVNVAERMLEELDSTTGSGKQIQELFEKVTEELSGPGLAAVQAQFRDFMRLHNRVGSVQKLMAAIKDAQVLERQAYGLDDDGKDKGDEFSNLSDAELDAKIEELQRAHARRADPQG